jgi:predicted RND superfamily exporter protein
MLSEYRPTAWFGGLLAVTMVVAFLAEVFVLPATIKLVPWFQGDRREILGRESQILGSAAGTWDAGPRS